ncbi:hypothetical protein FIBSPDRAFT_923812 [Athelia psychrophila]|uniref:RING-type E3 ubiquitin transferase n=1 Tax=Athelia psychrophila TaxID=1759441 RepID=A0A166WZE0_9AGAM|nr:hypothetical protein FIBSPDRAFT_923812 [Fibularhizoctonia sp. CBS 109695]
MPGLGDLLRRPRIPISASLSSHRILLYSVVSALAVSAAIANALKNHSNFYSVAIYLSRSNRSVLVLANFALLIALVFGRVFQQIFFGPLRPTEVERLYDRLWFFVTESLLAFTIFRDEFDIPFALIFGFLLFVKSFHWLASDRIEWMDQRPYPGPPTLFHVRMNSLLLLLWTIDLVMFAFAVESTVSNGVSGMVLFASEYAILMASAINTGAKYILTVIELRRAAQRGGESAPQWENKSMWVFYIELTTDFLKLTTYMVFFTLIITFYGLPLNILRDVYVTARSFVTRLRALQRYTRATRNMETRYPDATPDELGDDRTCIICREEMALRAPDAPAGAAEGGPNTTPKKLPCGHIFHFHCLRSWLERQQSCPTCRRTVLDADADAPPAPAQGAAGNPLPAGAGAGPDGAAPNPAAAPPARFPLLGNAPAHVPPPGWGRPGGPQEVVIQYNIHYQVGRAQPLAPPPPPVAQPQPPAELRPPPMNNGFVGAGGAWQPWDVDPAWYGPVPAPAPAPVPGDVQPAPTPTQPVPTTTQPAPTPTTPSTEPSAGITTPDTASAAAAVDRLDPEPVAAPQTPREAAALAALRRLGSSPGPAPPPAATPTIPASEPAEAEADVPAAGPSEPATLPTRRVFPTEAVRVPSVIPLYEYHRSSRQAHGGAYFRPRAPVPTSPTSPTASVGPTSPAHAPAHPYNPYTTTAPSNANANAATPLAQLPAPITDAQLAVMDRVTREAIDERLRVLEGVGGAVWRCVEELMRVRSALPDEATRALDAAIAGAREAAGAGVEAEEHTQREEREPAELAA